jgi:Flp pilus assembly pilin Flp
MVVTAQEWLLLAQVVTMQRAADLGARARARLVRAGRDERGQTPTEYLMIVGLMAAVVVLVFVTFYWGEVKEAASTWVTKVKESILGTGIQ